MMDDGASPGVEKEPYEAPPDSGSIRISISSRPVSLQGSGPAKDLLRATIRDSTRPFRYFLSGDVKLDVEWWIPERDRYESNASPDIDNILKLVIDSLCGPDGLLIDDCQVQAVSCRWVDNYAPKQRFLIEIGFQPELRVKKDGLLFVHFGDSLCVPLDDETPAKAQLLMLDLIEASLKTKKAMMNLSHDYLLARGVMPIQRFFHRGNLKGHRIKELNFLRRELQEKVERE